MNTSSNSLSTNDCKPVSDVARQAAEWFVILTSGTATDNDRANWQQWREQRAEHELAWQQIDAVTQKFSRPELSPALSLQILERPTSLTRRAGIKHLLLLVVVGAFAIAGYRQLPEWNAEYYTAIGEQREWVLDDGSRLTLNSNTAVDVMFDNDVRRIILQRGEMLIETAQEKQRAYRPLVAETAHGKITALGTRFTVQRIAEKTRVNLYQGQVNILTQSNQQLLLAPGQSADFSSSAILVPVALRSKTPYWIDRILVADDMPLLEFIAELSRYRAGYLLADSELAHLRISGAFPLNDIDAILRSLTTTLPIDVQRFTNYWVTLKPAERRELNESQQSKKSK